MTPRRKGRRALTALATLSLLTGTFVASNAALALAQSEFELDRNATNDLTTAHLGVTKSQVKTTDNSILVCQFVGGVYPAAGPFTIQIDGEVMTVTSYGTTSSQTGGCSFSDPALVASGTRVYNVTRVNRAAHPGDSDVTQLTTGAAAGDDWDQVHQSITADGNDTGDDDKCVSLGASECTWVHDGFNVSAFTTGGSKDDLNINPIAGESGTGWKWADTSVPPSDEILDAFAAKYTDGNSHQLLFFGADRWATNGAKDFGFWFFHDEVSLNPDGTFSGVHTRPTATSRGDILLLGTFTQGGAITSLRVFEWVGVGGDTNGTLDDLGSFGDCFAGGGNTNGCNTVNNTTVPSPWPYQGAASTNVSGQFYAGAFMEGGLDLTNLGLEGCFASFMAETRSSPEPGAQLKDFALGAFESCETTVTTTPADSAGTALTDSNDTDTLPEAQLGTGAAGVDVTDNVTVTVSGITTWSGEVDFFICGPIADPNTCDSGGVDAGAAQAVSNADNTATSPSVNLTEVGRYCWRGEFTPSTASATAGVDSGSDASATECFEVLPVTPTLTTTAWSTGDDQGSAQTDPVSFGSPLYDKGSLTGTAYEPGTDGADTTYPSINATMETKADGSIDFTLVGPDTDTTVCDTATPSAGTGDNPETVNVDGDDDYFTSGFTPDSPGDFHWVAEYTGSTSGNTTGTDHNTACDEPGEDVTVQQLQPTMDTSQSFIPNDSATVTVDAGAGDLDGDVTFYMWVDDNTCGNGDLTTADYTEGPLAVSDTDDPGDTSLSDSVETSNSTAYGTTGTTFDWIAVFESNTSAHLDVTSGCGNENSSITIDNGVTQPETP